MYAGEILNCNLCVIDTSHCQLNTEFSYTGNASKTSNNVDCDEWPLSSENQTYNVDYNGTQMEFHFYDDGEILVVVLTVEL